MNATTGEAITASPVLTCHLTPRLPALAVLIVVSPDTPECPGSCPNDGQSSGVAAEVAPALGSAIATTIPSSASARPDRDKPLLIGASTRHPPSAGRG